MSSQAAELFPNKLLASCRNDKSNGVTALAFLIVLL